MRPPTGKPWTIKGVDPAVSQAAADRARAADMTQAEYIALAIARMGNDAVLPPARPPPQEAAAPPAAPPAPLPALDLAGVAATMQAIATLAEAAGPKPATGKRPAERAMQASLAREAAATLRLYMRTARAAAKRQTERQTMRQTISITDLTLTPDDIDIAAPHD